MMNRTKISTLLTIPMYIAANFNDEPAKIRFQYPI